MSAPRVVAIGGGHGLATVLEALVDQCGELTAVVSVADDGGSSGRLRRELGIIAPGDMRRCLSALTPPGLIRDALEHRFTAGTLSGHPAGNILLASMLELADDPVVVMDTLVQMVGARGRILPATGGRVDLLATAERGMVRGQVAVSESAAIERLRFNPEDPAVPLDVGVAIGTADLVIVGPGSLYTSVLAAAVPGVRRAIEASRALVVYVANLAAEAGETTGYDLADLVAAVRRHGIEPDVILAGHDARVPGELQGRVRRIDLAGATAGLHDAAKLAAALSNLLASVPS